MDRRFAIMDTVIPAIPWAVIAPHEDRAKASHWQSLDRLDRRGGLHPSEACAIIERRPYQRMTLPEARACLRGHVDRYLAGSVA